MNYNNNKSSIDKSSIGLLQGKELRKYENQYKIDAIPHLTQLQKTSSTNLSNVDLNTKYGILENYEKVDDFKSYSKKKDLFNKSVSEYMLAKEYYMHNKDISLFENLEKLKGKIIKYAKHLKNSTNSLIVSDQKTKNLIEYEKNQIDSLLYSLATTNNKGVLVHTGKLNNWFRISILSILVLITLICVVKNIKSKQKYNILNVGFIIILIVLIYLFNNLFV
ncbi:MAG: hypothetical protein CMD14_09390 [Flavobacteriales bacterium]|nr:hypothetical protein [Flavobacteriales bacterium]|tara:strand:- start:3464 stop:4126 length:663 start_codon:yes stop_codon:yes gene_type:complete